MVKVVMKEMMNWYEWDSDKTDGQQVGEVYMEVDA